MGGGIWLILRGGLYRWLITSTLNSGPCSYESCESDIAGGGDTHFLPVTATWKDSFSEGCDPLRTRENIGGGGSGCACWASDWSEVAGTSLLGIGGTLWCLSSAAVAATGLVD